MVMKSCTVWHRSSVTRKRREKQNGHQGAILWFTGLSGAGKSTVAHAVEERLHRMGCRTFVLDGDNVRHGLCGDLGFSADDRSENIRRIGEVAQLFLETGVITLVALISPFRKDRDSVRVKMQERDFVEVYCRCALDVCESRDPKGMYSRARKGEIKEFTGISSPYEEPNSPELILETSVRSVDECATLVLKYIMDRGILPRSLESEVIGVQPKRSIGKR